METMSSAHLYRLGSRPSDNPHPHLALSSSSTTGHDLAGEGGSISPDLVPEEPLMSTSPTCTSPSTTTTTANNRSGSISNVDGDGHHQRLKKANNLVINSNLTSHPFLLCSPPPQPRSNPVHSIKLNPSSPTTSSSPTSTTIDASNDASSPTSSPQHSLFVEGPNSGSPVDAHFSTPPTTSNTITHSPSDPTFPSSIPTPLLHSLYSSASSTSHSHHHRRFSSQPSTPLLVKETLHGSLSEHPIYEGQRQLNQYLLLKTIGRGSFGSVELARDLSSPNQELYAVKEYSKSRLRKIRTRNYKFSRSSKANLTSRVKRSRRSGYDPKQDHFGHRNELSSNEGMQLVRTEVAIMKKLAHQNIVTLLEVIDTDDDSLFFVLELCRYGPIIDLNAKPNSKPLDEPKSRNIFQQIILGIEYLHFNEVLHLDIKPDNILFYQDPNLFESPICKIVDFGISESFHKSGDDTLKKSGGSPGFLAPELCLGTGTSTHGKMVDIWAMGVTLYAMVCGHLPFQDSGPIGLFERIIKDQVIIPDETSLEFKSLLKRLLDKSPDSRITMKELRVNNWVTKNGEEDLPDESTNLQPIEPPTEQEIDQAFKSIRSFATVFKAISKFRSKRKTGTMISNNSGCEEFDAITDDSQLTGTLSPSFKRHSTYLKQLMDSPMGSFEMNNNSCESSRSSTAASSQQFSSRSFRSSSGLVSTGSPLIRTPELIDRNEFVTEAEAQEKLIEPKLPEYTPIENITQLFRQL